MKISGGQRLRFRGLYFQEEFFTDNQIPLYDSFWRDAKNTINGSDLHAPELVSIYRRVEQCNMTGLGFDTWLKGIGLEAAGHLISLVQQLSQQQPVYLDNGEIHAVEQAKKIIETNLKHTPTILEICKKVGVVAETVGYHGISNFYAVFQRTFGSTPAAIQKMLGAK